MGKRIDHTTGNVLAHLCDGCGVILPAQRASVALCFLCERTTERFDKTTASRTRRAAVRMALALFLATLALSGCN